MTPRQREVLALLLAGWRVRDVARQLGITRKCVHDRILELDRHHVPPDTFGNTATARVVEWARKGDSVTSDTVSRRAQEAPVA